jgi:hypothetical protein
MVNMVNDSETPSDSAHARHSPAIASGFPDSRTIRQRTADPVS